MNASEQERETLVQTLMSLQTGCDERYVRQILQKHGWNVEQAATAILDVAETETEKKHGANSVDTWANAGALNSSNDTTLVPQRPNSVIDLTADDDEDTAKALAASMESPPVFGPSNRTDDTQQWAMVPSNAPPPFSQEDEALNRALEASLSSSFVGATQEPYEEPSDPTERVRKDGWPLALRAANSALCFAPVVLQCLLSLPNLRARLLRYNINCEGSEEQHAFARQLQRLAATLAHSARAYAAIDDILESLVPPSSSSQDTLPMATLQYYNALSSNVEHIPQPHDAPSLDTPLLSFEGIGIDAVAGEPSNSSTATYIEILAPSLSGNDLMSCLTDRLNKSKVCFTKLSECLVFFVQRQDVSASSGADKAPFKFPPRFHLDRFIRENLEYADELRNCQEGILHEAQKLATDRHKLSSWKNADTLRDLRSSVRYFESAAADSGDAGRKESHERSRLKLLEIIKQMEENIDHLETRYQELTADADVIFDKPELQKHGFDLRALIVHDGLYGRNHEYSYSKDDTGRWWKILDYQITEVSEEMVLNDSTGFHMGAGPLQLFYCQTSSFNSVLKEIADARWPRITRDLVRQDNYTLLAQLPTEIAETLISRSDASDRLFNDIGLDDPVLSYSPM